MRSKNQIIAIVIVFGIAGLAHAETQFKCPENPSTNSDFAACTAAEKQSKEAILKEVLDCVQSKAQKETPNSYKALLVEQEAWEKFKDTACKFYLDDYGREGQVIHYNTCKAKLIEERAKHLNHILDPYRNETCIGREL